MKKPTNIKECLETLNFYIDNPTELSLLDEKDRTALLKAAGKLTRPTPQEKKARRKEKRKFKKQAARQEERQARAQTGIRKARESEIFTAPKQLLLEESGQPRQYLATPRNCYVCKAEYKELHFFYDAMCPKCADFNYAKRFQTTDLTGQVALITGSRLKIGYQATLMMLRCGARVIATTRFPVDSAKRYAKEDDYHEWKDRLEIYGLDLRHTPSVEIFADYVIDRYQQLDLLINNAAQTVRRPAGFYSHLMADENKSFAELEAPVQHLLKGHRDCLTGIAPHGRLLDSAHAPDLPVSWHGSTPGIGLLASAGLSQIPYSYDVTLQAQECFPEGKLDADLQQVDLRTTNSWRLKLGEIETGEMFELQLVNSIAPFVLCNRLIPLMKLQDTGNKHIVNVSAMEGKFHRFKKYDRHPHTNMAKAALNMMTHTAAGGLAKHGIYMNAVDTGWVTDEDPAHLAKFKEEYHDFQPPLDIVDGAARVCDPFIDGINTGKHWCGKFLKDYFPIDW